MDRSRTSFAQVARRRPRGWQDAGRSRRRCAVDADVRRVAVPDEEVGRPAGKLGGVTEGTGARRAPLRATDRRRFEARQDWPAIRGRLSAGRKRGLRRFFVVPGLRSRDHIRFVDVARTCSRHAATYKSRARTAASLGAGTSRRSLMIPRISAGAATSRASFLTGSLASGKLTTNLRPHAAAHLSITSIAGRRVPPSMCVTVLVEHPRRWASVACVRPASCLSSRRRTRIGCASGTGARNPADHERIRNET